MSTLKEINLKDLQIENVYSFRYEQRQDVLLNSVARYGILTPVIVYEDEGFHLVAGSRRYQAAKKNKLSTLPAICIEGDISKKELFIIALTSNLNQTWTEYEILKCIARASDVLCFEQELIVKEILPLLGINASPHIYRELKSYSQMDEVILNAIGRGELTLRGCKGFSFFSEVQQKVFFENVWKELKLSVNETIRVCEWLRDLKDTLKVSLGDLLERDELQLILINEAWDSQTKTVKFIEEVRNLKFPQLSQRAREFERVANSIAGSTHDLKVEAPLFFEDEGFTLKAKLRNSESLERIMNILGDKRKLLNSLFDIML